MSVEDIKKGQEEYIQRVRKEAEILQSLIAHPGWKVFRNLVEAVAQGHANTALQPLENVMLVTKIEYAKGTLNGLQLAVDLPHHKIAEMEELRNPNHEEGNAL